MTNAPRLTERERKLQELQEEGRRAFRNRSTCPYAVNTVEYRVWQQGYQLQKEEYDKYR